MAKLPASAQAKLAAAARLREQAEQLAAEAREIQKQTARQASKLRPRGLVPAGFQWRDGRPRWFAHDKLRAAGWKGVDLKDARGDWLPKGDAIERAEDIVKAVEGWKKGQAVPVAFESFAPQAATDGGALPAQLDPRSIGALLDKHMGVPGKTKGTWAIPPSVKFAKIKNQADRRSKLSRFVDVLAGYPTKPDPRKATAKELAEYERARALARSKSIFTLEPPPYDPRHTAQLGDNPLTDAYTILEAKAGHNMAYGVITEVSAWLNWCVKTERVIPANWATSVERTTPDGRIRVATWDELAALIAAADDLEKPSIGDAVILGVDLSWNQGDRLHLTWPQIKDFRAHATRRKTGRKGATPLLESLGKPRLAQIRERQAAMFGAEVQPTHVIICEATRQPYKADWYRSEFATVRAHAIAMLQDQAAKANDPDHAARLRATADTLADLRDQDLRDTAVTVAYDAGLDMPEIASRTLHSLKRIEQVLEKHYGQISQHVADRGAQKLNAHLAEKGVKL